MFKYSTLAGCYVTVSHIIKYYIHLVDGTCYGIPAGNIRVDLNIAACDDYSSSDSATGWNSPRSMVIMEIIPTTQLPGNFVYDDQSFNILTDNNISIAESSKPGRNQ